MISCNSIAYVSIVRGALARPLARLPSAVYEMDEPYPYELHSVKLSAEQMLAIFSEAASKYGVAIAEGGERWVV